jgi:guanylate kinase
MQKITAFVGPSGVGKTTICRSVNNRFEDVREVVSTTTRSKRSGEVDGVDYRFLTREQSDTYLANGDYLEHVEYDGNFYGFLYESFQSEERLVLVIDRHGLSQLKQAFGDRVQSILVLPPSLEVLTARMMDGQRSAEVVARRLHNVEAEIYRDLLSFDYVIVNRDLEDAVDLASYIVIK